MKGKLIDLTGIRFGRLLVIEQAERNKYQKPRWLCLCDCGKKKAITSRSLRKGLSRSCGCLNREKVLEKIFIDLTGKRFGRLFVIKKVGSENGRVIWECLCDCGTTHTAAGNNLKNGNVSSCGCLARELSAEKLRLVASRNIGALNPAWKGGTTPEGLKYYNSQEHADWRNAVFARDGYQCSDCGSKKPPFNAHHIKMRSKYKELRTDTDNGITLCESCHDKIRGHEDEHIERLSGIVASKCRIAA